MVAINLTLLMAVAAFVVDLGFLRVARQDMQAVADIVALDMARELDGRTAFALSSDLATAKSHSVARNNAAKGNDLAVSHESGILSETGTFTPVSGTGVPDAGRVVAATSVDYFISPGNGETARSAIATADSPACFSLGSYAAAVRTASSRS